MRAAAKSKGSPAESEGFTTPSSTRALSTIGRSSDGELPGTPSRTKRPSDASSARAQLSKQSKTAKFLPCVFCGEKPENLEVGQHLQHHNLSICD